MQHIYDFILEDYLNFKNLQILKMLMLSKVLHTCNSYKLPLATYNQEEYI